MVSFEEVEAKVESGERLSREDARACLRESDLAAVGALADRVRHRRLPGHRVTFVVDSNPSYTNVCVTDCKFCAFYRPPGHPEAYTLGIDEVLERIAHAAAAGATTVLLQGGHNPALPLDYYLALVRETKRRFPGISPHFFSASEIRTVAEAAGRSVRDVLQALYDAGQRSLPGGGAEILSETVRRKLAPKKGGPEAWLDVHREAHRVGMRSTATMMYGHVETEEDVLDHLEKVRALQDETGGFTAFIPWSFKPGNTVLGRKPDLARGPAGACRYLRMIAVGRLFLDNVPHVQASWFSEGKRTGQIALHFGADDFGGTLLEENVHRAARFVNRATTDEVITLIREAGFIPVQRTTLYEVVREHPGPAAPAASEGACPVLPVAAGGFP